MSYKDKRFSSEPLTFKSLLIVRNGMEEHFTKRYNHTIKMKVIEEYFSREFLT